MKATAQRKVSLEVALNFILRAIESIAGIREGLTDCRCSGACTCPARYESYQSGSDGISAMLDWTGVEVGVRFPASDTVIFWSRTCGGYLHELKIVLGGDKAILTAYHEGVRSSTPDTLICYLPEVWGELSKAKYWELVEVETSRPEWATPVGLLQGKFGDGPVNESEDLYLRGVACFKDMVGKCRKLGIPAPDDFYWEDSNNLTFYQEGKRWELPKASGLLYRRAAAFGVNI